MTANEFRAMFDIGETVASGGSRSKLCIKDIADSYVSVIPIHGKAQTPMRLNFDELTAVINGFDEIDPKRVEPTVKPVLARAGLKQFYTEGYLYGFAREWRKRSGELGMMLPQEIPPDLSVWEGAKKTITVNAYERRSAARRACIAHWGATCKVCDMSFVDVYGIADGFIHVHHLKPLGEMGKEYKLDPVKDLCPVCANCHAMLHARKPAMEVQQLKELLQQRLAATLQKRGRSV